MADRKKPKPETEAAAPAAAVARPSNNTVGETLRAAREAKKLDLEKVSQTIHIRPVQLKAIEENNIDSLPGMTYAVGFVRSYANYLGLNGAEIVHRFKAEHGHDPANSKLSFPEPIAESRVPDPMMVGVGAFLAVVILVLWTVYSNMHSGSKSAEATPAAPVVTTVADSLPAATTTTPAAATTTPATVPATSATGTELPAVGTTATTAPVTPTTTIAPVTDATATAAQPAIPTITPADQQSAAAIAPAVLATIPAKTETPAAKPAKKEAASSDDADSEDDMADDEDAKSQNDDGVIKIKKGKSRITLKATEDSWIQVTDANGKVLYRKVLRPGEQYSVPDQSGLRLDTANAGGFEVAVDGKQVQHLGKEGDVLRDVTLDAQELKTKRLQRN